MDAITSRVESSRIESNRVESGVDVDVAVKAHKETPDDFAACGLSSMSTGQIVRDGGYFRFAVHSQEFREGEPQ